MKKLLIAALLLLFITPISFFGQAPAFADTSASAEPAPLAVEAAEAASLAVNDNGSFGFIQIPFQKFAETSVWLQGIKGIFEQTANAEGKELTWDEYTKVSCDVEVVFYKGDTAREFTLQAPITIDVKYWWNNRSGVFIKFPDTVQEFEIANDKVWQILSEQKPESFYLFLVDNSKHLIVNEVQKDSLDPGFYVGTQKTMGFIKINDFSAVKFKGYTTSAEAVTSNPILVGSRITNPPQAEDALGSFELLCRKIDEAAGLEYGTTLGYASLIGKIFLGLIGVVSLFLVLFFISKLTRLIKRSLGG